MNPSLTDGGANSAPEPPAPIAGDRGPAWVKRGASVQSKVQNALALAVVALLGGGFLTWYYTGLAAKPVALEQTKAKQAAQGEMKLPPLGPAPVRPVVKPEQTSALVDSESAEAQVLLAGGADSAGLALAGGPPAGYPPPAAYAAPPPPDPVQQRRLEAPVLIRGAGSFTDASDPEVGADAALDGQRGGRPRTGFAGTGSCGLDVVRRS